MGWNMCIRSLVVSLLRRSMLFLWRVVEGLVFFLTCRSKPFQGYTSSKSFHLVSGVKAVMDCIATYVSMDTEQRPAGREIQGLKHNSGRTALDSYSLGTRNYNLANNQDQPMYIIQWSSEDVSVLCWVIQGCFKRPFMTPLCESLTSKTSRMLRKFGEYLLSCTLVSQVHQLELIWHCVIQSSLT